MAITSCRCSCSCSWLPLRWNLKGHSLKWKCQAFACSLLRDDHNDLQRLLHILPSDLHHNLLNQPNRSQLLEVTVKELEYAEQAVGEFGKDNRAGIEGTLHRISAIRSRNGHIVGLTCRVGRAFTGQVEMVYDLLQYGKSVLFVGRYTTLFPVVKMACKLKFWIARVLSDELHKRVVIVDTSNEIGGDGNVPHAAIGNARRMQVPEPSMQHRVMIEAVENHMPEVIIVDEIGTEAEAHACRSIAERGIMLIGTAHGQQIENIIKNPTLSDLIGGIETVTLGDAEARARNCQKTILERKAPPTFDFLIEMRDRHYWLTHQASHCIGHLSREKKVLMRNFEDVDFNCILVGALSLRSDPEVMSFSRLTDTAWVEGGATLGETYYAISQASKGHGFSAGSCPTVGVGGHIGGGGFGLLSRKYGLAADNVVDALLVDAEGKLFDRESMEEDIFWAIRGGGGGLWGIVYAWKIQVLKVPQIVTSFTVSRTGTKSHVAKLVHKWQYVAPNLEGDFYLSCFVGAGLPQAKTTGLSTKFNGFYLGPRASAISILNQAFPELVLVEEECIDMSWIQSIVFFSGLSERASVSELKNRYLQEKEYFKAKSDYVKKHVPLVGIETALDFLEREPKGYVILDPYGGMMHNISSESIAFPHRIGNLFTIQYLIYWKESDKDKSSDYVDWIRGFYAAMTPFVSWGPRAAYINYMDFDLGVMGQISNGAIEKDTVENARVWGEKYFLSNYERLVRAKTLIDPNNVFTNEQGIPPISVTSPNVKAQSQ
ncbi:hypothetical protein Fmac_024417 [Flemingia macrophylla]|uniref:FAD-binding PCMH-type domain-containing protein n=1 Tax=Flemingia macrophylla TaxID=520843 RepID=A0ABD1LPC2_9FABA